MPGPPWGKVTWVGEPSHCRQVLASLAAPTLSNSAPLTLDELLKVYDLIRCHWPGSQHPFSRSRPGIPSPFPRSVDFAELLLETIGSLTTSAGRLKSVPLCSGSATRTSPARIHTPGSLCAVHELGSGSPTCCTTRGPFPVIKEIISVA